MHEFSSVYFQLYAVQPTLLYPWQRPQHECILSILTYKYSYVYHFACFLTDSLV